MRLKVMTYNIQHGKNHNSARNVIDLKNTVVPILYEKPDILGLNEVRCGSGFGYCDQPKKIAKLCGGTPLFGKALSLGKRKCYGNALVAKLPVRKSKAVDIPDPAVKRYGDYYETRSILCAEIDCGGQIITYLCTHFGLNPDEREIAVNTVLELVNSTDMPVILTGDFNAEPDDEQIKRLSSSLHNMAEILGNVEPTFPSDEPKVCIDYIFYRGLKPLNIHTVKGIYSDHLPLTAEFEV